MDNLRSSLALDLIISILANVCVMLEGEMHTRHLKSDESPQLSAFGERSKDELLLINFTLVDKCNNYPDIRPWSEIKLLAGTLYGECTTDSDFCLQSVAWTIINRQTRNVTGNIFYDQSYRNIVCQSGQFAGLVGSGAGKGLGRSPDTSSTKWIKALAIANKMVIFQKDRKALSLHIINKIEKRRYFLNKDYFNLFFAPRNSTHYIKPINKGDNTFFYLKEEGM